MRVYIERPDGQIVEHRPPVYRLIAPEDVLVLSPGERHVTPVQLSFPATGPEFVNPGQYRVRALVTPDVSAMLPSNDLRIRVAHPVTRLGEELTELVTRPEVAKFLYFGGSARRPAPPRRWPPRPPACLEEAKRRRRAASTRRGSSPLPGGSRSAGVTSSGTPTERELRRWSGA